MPLTPAALERAIRKQQQWLKLLDGIDKAAGVDAQTFLDSYAKVILRIVGVESNTTGAAFTTAREVHQATLELEKELRLALERAGIKYEKHFAAIKTAQLKGSISAYSEFGKTTATRVRAAARAFDKINVPGSFQQGRNKWLTELGRTGGQLRDNLREKMVQAQLEGLGQHQLAQRIVADPLFRFENLPNPNGAKAIYRAESLGENVALRHRAEVIARDANSVAANRMHEEWTQKAGFTHYINYNPKDSRTTPGCNEASRQKAMTLEQWDKWKATSDGQAGRPPRWYGCRSQLMAVPPELRNQTGQ